MPYEAVIGLEVHAQLRTATKMFCGCAVRSGGSPNTSVCAVCTGQPGALPAVNGRAVEMACMVAGALGCGIRRTSRFARKNYFYPDLPKGYQITQHEMPLAERGRFPIRVGSEVREIGITRVHLEEDAGRSVHDAAGGRTLVDLDRCGVPLVEIVSEPAIRSPEEAAEYLRQLRLLLLHLGVCDGNLQDGSLRCDTNVSVRPAGSEALGAKVEVKNLNSFRHVRDALAHEIRRQTDALEAGGEVRRQTRLWNDSAGRTEPMREKEEADDYRYFPEPDLPPLTLDEAFLAGVRARLAETPFDRRVRFERDLGLSAYDSGVLVVHPAIADLFEETGRRLAEAGVDAPHKRAANFVMTEVLRGAGIDGLDAKLPVDADRLAELIGMVARGELSASAAKEVFAEAARSGDRPAAVVGRLGLAQVSDEGALLDAARAALAESPLEAGKYRKGNTRVLGFLVGKVMKAMGGSANPRAVSEILVRLLSEDAAEGKSRT